MEPLEVLAAYQRGGQWVLGKFLDGHEFLIILPVLEYLPVPFMPALLNAIMYPICFVLCRVSDFFCFHISFLGFG
ncbi:hypothetical protein BS17DRAFT_301471 [Gyrodon lividus]|nr:hypothetical protein BS17DRAFT_301471 [Gyrodon lividus]